MYCKKCGKFIGNDSDFCDECAMKEDEIFSEFADKKTETDPPVYEYVSTPTYNGGSQVNLGRAIAAAVLSEIGFIFMYIAIIAFSVMLELDEYAGVIVCTLIGLTTSILGLIFGIKSIKHFKETSCVRSGKRIPLLILGICSVVMAGIGLFFAFIVLMLLALLI